MAIIEAKKERGFRAGHFLVSEECTRKTYSVFNGYGGKSLGDGTYLYSAGDVIRIDAGNSNYVIIGVCYEDVLFTVNESEDECILSVVTGGSVYASLLTYKGEQFSDGSDISYADAEAGLKALGINVVNDYSAAVRPFTD